MRRRRAERLVLRADAAIDAGDLDQARASLDEARALWSGAPRLLEVETKLETRTQATAAASRIPVAWKEVAAAVAAVLLVVTAAIVVLATAWRNPLRARDATAFVAPATVDQRITIPEIHSAAPQQDHHAGSTATLNREPATGPALAEPQSSVPASGSPAPETAIPEKQSPTPDTRSPLPNQRTPLPVSRTPVPDPPSPVPALRSSISDLRPPTDAISIEPTVPDVGSTASISVPRPSEPVTVPIVVATTGASLPPAAETAPPQPAQETLIRGVLARYAEAYNDLDVAAAERVWPSVNRSALTRAFETLEWQQVSLGQCSIQVDGNTARASCAGHAAWTPKIGGREHHDARSWSFDLEKSGGGWLIRNARVQNR